MFNILFYYPTPIIPSYGGVERVTDILSHEFINRGYNVFYLNRYQEETISSSDIETYYLPSKELNSIDNVLFYKNLLLKKNINIIINQHGHFEGTYLLNRDDIKIPIINVIHSNPILNLDYLLYDISRLRNDTFIEKIKRIARVCLYWKIKKEVFNRLKKHFDYIFIEHQYVCLLSEKYIQTLDRFNPLLRNKTFAIGNPNTYNSIDFIDKKEKLVLFVGRLDNSSKKIDVLLDIWEQVVKKNNDWKLAIVGDGKDKKYIIRKASRIKNVYFEGRQDPIEYYSKASILCLTSIFEGFPMVLTEAMQYSCVPIAFGSFPAVYEIIHSGSTGEIIKPFDKNEYQKKLNKLMNDEAYLKKLSYNAYESVKRYDKNIIVNHWLDTINSIQKRNE